MSGLLKTIKIIFIVIASIILLMLATAFIASEYFGDELKEMAVVELNKHVQTKVDVGKVELSFIANFPYASIQLENVTIMSTNNYSHFELAKWDTDTLLNVRHISLSFHLLSMFNDNLNLKKIEIKNGGINLLIDKRGDNNFRFWTNSSSGTDSALTIDLKNVTIKDVKMLFVKRNQEIVFDQYISKLSLSGNFTNDNFFVDMKTNMLVKSFLVSNIKYIENRDCELRLKLSAKSDLYNIEKGTLKIENLLFNVAGNINLMNDPILDININSRNLDITSFTSMLPDAYKSYVKDIESTGVFSLNTKISGKLSDSQSPHVDLHFGIDNATLKNKARDNKIVNLNAAGTFSNGKYNTSASSSFVFDNLSFNLAKSSFSIGGKISNLSKPKLHVNCILKSDLSDLEDFVDFDNIDFLKGIIEGDVKLDASLNIGETVQLNELNWKGKLNIDSINLKLKENTNSISKFSGKIVLSGKDAYLSSASLNYADCDFKIDAKVSKPVNWVLDEDAILYADANIESSYLDFDKFTNEDSNVDFTIPDNYNFNINLKLGSFKYDRINVKDVISKLSLSPNKLLFNNLSFYSLNGSASGSLIISETDNIRIVGKASISNIDIHEFFYSFYNFGQSFIKADNLTGDITGDINFDSKWTKQLEVIDSTILVESSVDVKNGELYDFEPMQELSNYLRVPDLRNISFSSLHNDIVIQDEKIYIPNMDIKSSALNLEISGIHDFNQNISYDIKLLLSEILEKRFKKKNNSEWVIEEDTEGGTPIFLNIEGNVDDFDISYDYKRAKREMKKNRQEEKQEFKSALHEEFGLFKKDSSLFKQLKKKKEDAKKKKKVEIIWDEDEDF